MIKVLKAGLFSTIQDLGRFSAIDYGVPVSGTMDQQASTLANLILGNHENSAVLEITISGPTLKFLTSSVICISGANLSPKINNENIDNNKTYTLNLGDVLSFGSRVNGSRAYLAILGGFNSDVVLESRSMYKSITQTDRINKGDILEINNSEMVVKHNAKVKINQSYINSNIIEVFKGPEFDVLPQKAQYMLLENELTISNLSNRMAYRFNETISNHTKDIITSLVLPGTVQLTPLGDVIVLMRDCQTTGGYPRIFQLKEESINILSQKLANEKVRFGLVN